MAVTRLIPASRKEEGDYFLRISEKESDEEMFWKSSNAFRALEVSFRILKTDRVIHPVFHKTGENTKAQLVLAVLAHQQVSIIHLDLKTNGIHYNRLLIARILNMQKVLTVSMQGKK